MKKHYPDLSELLGMSFQAGDIMRGAFAPGMMCEWKADNTPCTVFDKSINRLVIKRIKHKYPHVSVIGEEETYGPEDSEYTVLLDPIDGTIPFCHGVPVSTFCISLLKNRVPIVAVVSDPFHNRTWSAEKGCGTTLNGVRVKVTNCQRLAQSTVSIMWWKGAIGNLHKVCNELVDRNVTWLNLSSVAIAGGLISSRDLEASIFPGEKSWETAAMQLLVEEAGGTATDLYGKKLVYSKGLKIPGHIMSNGYIHDDLVAIVRDAKS